MKPGFFEETLHFAYSVEMINGRWKLCHHCCIVAWGKREHEPRARFHDAVDVVQMPLGVAPEIQGVNRIDTIKALGRVGDPFTAGTLHRDASAGDEPLIPMRGGFDHVR